MPRTLPRKRIKPPLMVVPTASNRKTYKYHTPPKVKGTQNYSYQLETFQLSLSYSDFIIRGSPTGTTPVTHFLLPSLVFLQVAPGLSGRLQRLTILASSHMYAKNEDMDSAEKVFANLSKVSVVSC